MGDNEPGLANDESNEADGKASSLISESSPNDKISLSVESESLPASTITFFFCFGGGDFLFGLFSCEFFLGDPFFLSLFTIKLLNIIN